MIDLSVNSENKYRLPVTGPGNTTSLPLLVFLPMLELAGRCAARLSSLVSAFAQMTEKAVEP